MFATFVANTTSPGWRFSGTPSGHPVQIERLDFQDNSLLFAQHEMSLPDDAGHVFRFGSPSA